MTVPGGAAEPCVLIIFGAAGDLSMKKLLPAVYALAQRRLLPKDFALVGVDQKPLSLEGFTASARSAIDDDTGATDDVWQWLLPRLRYVSGNFTEPKVFVQLAATLAEVDNELGTQGNHSYHLAVPPAIFDTVAKRLHHAGLISREGGESGWRRLVVEKPFGTDHASANALDETLKQYLPDESIYRVDHYLGKAAVQNLVPLRFKSEALQRIWDHKHIDHVQITQAEANGVDGRGRFYDRVGAARDVMQNHVLQLLALIAMEKPGCDSAQHLSQAKAAVLKAVKVPGDMAIASARGQYAAAVVDGDPQPAFREEDGIDGTSTTESYAALRLEINTERWRGVPFYLRTGKRLSATVTEIALVLKSSPGLDGCDAPEHGPHTLVIRIQPHATVMFVPACCRTVELLSHLDTAATSKNLDGYERLIFDVFRGDRTLFPQYEEIEQSWRIIDPLIAFWREQGEVGLEQYSPGSWGPESADRMLASDEHKWRSGADINPSSPAPDAK